MAGTLGQINTQLQITQLVGENIQTSLNALISVMHEELGSKTIHNMENS